MLVSSSANPSEKSWNALTTHVEMLVRYMKNHQMQPSFHLTSPNRPSSRTPSSKNN